MILSGMPVTDDHIHFDPRNGLGVKAARDFYRAGGTHMFLVTKPSWSLGVHPVRGEDFMPVFEETLKIAEDIREAGPVVFPVLGVHPAEITKLTERMSLAEAEELMKRGLDLAAKQVAEGQAVALKSGRPHYEVAPEIWAASNRVLAHAIILAAECGCALQIHAESGPCDDVLDMARSAHMPPDRIVKHFAVPETSLVPSFIARHEDLAQIIAGGRECMMESDFMDDNTRPGSVIGPKSVPRFTRRLLESDQVTTEQMWRVHRDTPSRVYGVSIEL